MKLRDYFGVTVFSATLALLYSSCRDQDFDWEDHYRENVEYQYQEIIKSIFGEISPDQSWDFSGFSAADTVATINFLGTRAANGTNITTINGHEIYRENSWYENYQGLIKYANTQLIETKPNRDKGKTFVIQVPEYGFKITPLYTGQSLNWSLYIQKADANGNLIDNSPIKIWDKGTNMQVKVHNCFRIVNVNSNPNKTLGVNNNGTLVANTNHENDVWGFVSINNNGNKFNVIVNLKTGKYLGYDGGNHKFVCNDGEMRTVSSNKGRYDFRIDDVKYPGTNNQCYRFYINGHYIVEGGGTIYDNDNNTDEKLNNNEWIQKNSCWTLEEVNDPVCENMYQDKVGLGAWNLSQVKLSYYDTSNLRLSNYVEWKNINKYTASLDYLGVTDVRTKTIVIEPGVFTPGSYVALFLQITDNRIYSEAQMIDATSNGGNVIGTKLLSKDQMIALNVPENSIPKGKKTIEIEPGRYVANSVYIVGCEDANVPADKHDQGVQRSWVECLSGFGVSNDSDQGKNNYNTKYVKSDWDFNDLLLMIEGYGLNPTDVKYDYEPFKKRYMVEDLGFDGQKKINKTDIDFNDIVVDIIDNSHGYRYNKDNKGIRIEDTKTPYTNTTEKAEVTIWALGGTLDFTLYTYDASDSKQYSANNRIAVFKKSTASGTNINPNYKINNTSITGLTSSTMYNTHLSHTGCDGNFNQNLFIWRKTFDYGQLKWDHAKNNIVFALEDNNYLGENPNSTGDTQNVYENIITFPAPGTMPKIIAFPIGTEWNKERQGIDEKWPLGGTFPNGN